MHCEGLEVSQDLPEAAKRAIVEEYMPSSYFKSIYQEMARRAATTIREDLRSRHPSLDLSFMTVRYGIGLEPLASVILSSSELPPSSSHPQPKGDPSSPSFKVFKVCAPFEKL